MSGWVGVRWGGVGVLQYRVRDMDGPNVVVKKKLGNEHAGANKQPPLKEHLRPKHPHTTNCNTTAAATKSQPRRSALVGLLAADGLHHVAVVAAAGVQPHVVLAKLDDLQAASQSPAC